MVMMVCGCDGDDVTLKLIIPAALVFPQKIHRALNMTYEDVKKQRASTEKR